MSMKAGGELGPGGLAMVIGSYSGDSVNVGKIVELQQIVHPGEKWRGVTYRPKSGRCSWVVTGEGVASRRADGSYPVCGFCFALPENLMPIKPSAEPLEISQQMEEKV